MVLPQYLLDLHFEQIFEQIEKENVFAGYITEEEKKLASKLCSYILELTLI